MSLTAQLDTCWLSQLQCLQDHVSSYWGVSLMVLDDQGHEVTVPSGLQPGCTQQLSEQQSSCKQALIEAISRVRMTRYAAALKCPAGRSCFVSPVGVGVDDCDKVCQFFLVGSAPSAVTPEVLELVQMIFRLIQPVTTETQSSAKGMELPVAPFAEGPEQSVLTKRQSEVLALIGAGLSNREIANRLYISEATVKSHMTQILQKLDLANRTEAALYAHREDMVPAAGH